MLVGSLFGSPAEALGSHQRGGGGGEARGRSRYLPKPSNVVPFCSTTVLFG